MHKFKVGDKVRCIRNAPDYCMNSWIGEGGLLVGYEAYVVGFRGDFILFTYEGKGFSSTRFELIKEQDMPVKEKKYKITTELTLQQVADLKRALALAYGFKCLYNELHSIHKEAQRKVVKVGDKEYYEDELSAALANIKPIKEL